ncbi:flotillin family protein [Gordonia sp. PDNC005]|uniref:flotillin family protein n=1 Tax=unclassified Gordonia (in: high G+C Gram-positive bacteria) TaxID=2657482 RepID=UPI0019653B5C|nr:flotillin family protein [Gordonia sp. PDNC005]QRY64251.1 flotillin family protein [Gordonia sp. PDNC005]
MTTVIWAVAAVVVLLVLVVLLLLSRYRVPGAEEAFIVTGTGKGHQGKVYRGTGTFVLPVVQRATRVQLSSIKADLDTSTPANDGIELKVRGVAVVKVGDTPEDILKAGPRFGDDLNRVNALVTEQLSGELRSIVGTMTAKSILVDRQQLVDQVAQSIKEILGNQGLVLDSFSINDVQDSDGQYFSDLAAKERSDQSAIAAQSRAEAHRVAEQSRIANEQAIIEQQRELDIQREAARQATDRAAAEADSVRPLVEAERRRIQVEKDNEVAEQAARLRDTQLDAEVRRPAEAELYAAQQRAEARRAEITAEAEAKAAGIRITGEAEAEALEKRADALGKLDKVGQLELVMNKLPDIVRAAAEPLADSNITLIGDSVSPLTRSAGAGVASTLEVIRSTTGIDVASMLADLGQSGTTAVEKPSDATSTD